jgi:hypothetical protein
MKWEQVLTLLHIAETANGYPKLHALRDTALSVLESADLESLHFADHVEEEE